MIEIERKELKTDPVFSMLYDKVKKNHKIAEHTKKVLIDNKNVKDFCEEARHFVKLEGKTPVFLHYDTSSWLKKSDQVLVRIDRVGIYDDFMEYEGARVRGIHGGKPSDIPNVN